MAENTQTDHETTEKGKFQPIVTAYAIIIIVVIALIAIFTNPHEDYRQYNVTGQKYVIAATTGNMPSPLDWNGQRWLPVNDAEAQSDAVAPTGQSVKGYPILKSSEAARKDLIYLRGPDGRLQPYVSLSVAAGEEADAQEKLLAELPAAFRFRGYTWHQVSNAVSKSDDETYMPIGTVLGRSIFALEPGPEAHRSGVYVEILPGGETYQPYVPVETLYSTSLTDSRDPNSGGLSGKPNPFPVIDGENLPMQAVQDPEASEKVLTVGPAGEVKPVAPGASSQGMTEGKPNMSPSSGAPGDPAGQGQTLNRGR